jgi:4a-hydroxytetrahydrobiopterin dehydratase
MNKLDPSQLAPLLASLPDWQLDSQRIGITREYTFADFLTAFDFMAKMATVAEARNHHPEWTNVYNRVRITWTTHDAGGLTLNDIDMARECDQCFVKLVSSCVTP